MTRKTAAITVIAYDFPGQEVAFTRMALVYSSKNFQGNKTKQKNPYLLVYPSRYRKTAAPNEPPGVSKGLRDFFSSVVRQPASFFFLFLSAISKGDLIHVSNKITKAEKHSTLSSVAFLAPSLNNYFYSSSP